MKNLLCLLAAFVLVTPAFCQEAPEPPTFRVTTSQVVVEFIAVEKKSGRFIDDLKKDEIELLVDGKKRKLDLLLPPSLTGRAGTALVTPVTVNRGTGVATGPSTELSTTSKGTVILLDTRTLDAGNFHHAVSAIERFISRSLAANHLVMIAEIDQGLQMLTPFTRDRSALVSAVQQLKPATVSNPLDPSRMLSDAGGEYIDELQKQMNYLRSGLTMLCYSLSGLPGRKQVVFFSEGYPLHPLEYLELEAGHAGAFESADTRQQTSRDVGSRKDPGVFSTIQEAVALANSFGVTFHTIDARGLVAVPGIGKADVAGDVAAGPGESLDTRAENPKTGHTEVGLTEVTLSLFQLTNLNTLDDASNALTALAGGTNGTSFFNTNDLESVLRAAVAEQDHAYLAGFDPKSKGKDKFHRLKVRCSRPDVVIRSQVGYQDRPEEQAVQLRMLTALQNPGLFKHLTPVAQPQTQQKPPALVIGIPGSQIFSRPKGDQFQIDLLFAGRIFDSEGKPVSQRFDVVRAFQLDLTSEQFRSLEQQPLLASQDLDLPPGNYMVRLAVEDRIAGTMGVTEATFEIP